MKLARKELFLFLLLSFLLCPKAFSLSVEDYCKAKGVDPIYVKSIAELESIKRRGYSLGYPFVIRVNDRRVTIDGLREISDNVYDCENYAICVYTAEKLIKNGVENFDMGVFQINYHYNKHRKNVIARAFNTEEAFKIACDIISENMEKFGKNLTAVAMYHSYRRRTYIPYKRKLEVIYRRKLKERQRRKKSHSILYFYYY